MNVTSTSSVYLLYKWPRMRPPAVNCKILPVNPASVFPLRKTQRFCPWNSEGLLGEANYNRTKYAMFLCWYEILVLELVQKDTTLLSCQYALREGVCSYKLSRPLKKLKVQYSFRWEYVNESTCSRFQMFLWENLASWKGRLSWPHSRILPILGWPYLTLGCWSPVFSTSSLPHIF